MALMRPRGKGPPLILAAALLSGLLARPTTAMGSDTCRTSGPGSGAFTVTLCFTAPAPGDVLKADTDVSASVTVSTTTQHVRWLEFFLDAEYVITDFEAPYTFVLPIDRWSDGLHRLKVQAVMSGDKDWTSPRTVLDVDLESPGGSTSPRPFSPHVPSAAVSPVVVAAVADGASGRASGTKVTELISSWDPDMLLYAGDVYQDGTPTEFYNWWGHDGNGWSAFDAMTNPAPGNHEYGTPGAAGYFEHWGDPPHSYSYDAGGWHFVSLDSTSQFGQTAPGTPQYEWLRSDLLNDPSACTIVYFHHPPFSLGDKVVSVRMQDFWKLLAARGVDIVVSGHEHNYIRWKPMDANARVDPNGTTAFVVGTGGHYLYPQPLSDPRVAKRYAWRYGALRLDLSDGSAAFSFVGSGGAVLDAGTIDCSPTIDDVPPPRPAAFPPTQ